MLGESSVPAAQGSAEPVGVGGSPSIVLSGPGPEAADATDDTDRRPYGEFGISDHSRTASTQPVGAGSASSGPAGIYRVHEGAGCAVCGGERPLAAVLHGDPFCSSRHARAWYGCPLDPATERPEKRAA